MTERREGTHPVHFKSMPLSPSHCGGWVCFFNSLHGKTKDPWNAVHGLFNTYHHITQSMGFLIHTTAIAPIPPCLNHSEWGFACFRFISAYFHKYIFEGRGARYRIDIFRNQHIRLGKIHQRIALPNIKRAHF